MPACPRLTARDGALLVVDIQERLIPAIRQADRVITHATRLVRGANLLGVPTVATEQVPTKLGPTVAPLVDLLPQRLTKTTFHAGGAAGLWDQLDPARVQHIALIGIETHICVAQTAGELLARGFTVQIPVDAVGARYNEDHEIALRRLCQAGAIITTVEAILFEWTESADHPRFRELSALAKERTDTATG